MTTIHIIQSSLEIIAILALTYAIYRHGTAPIRPCKRLSRWEGNMPNRVNKAQDKPVVFTGRDILYEEDRQ